MSMMCRPKWPFLHMYGSHDMRHVDFRGLTGSQQTPGFWGVTESFVDYSITFEYLKLYLIITLRATFGRQQGMKSKHRINIQDILEHLKSKDTCTIAMTRLSSTLNR